MQVPVIHLQNVLVKRGNFTLDVPDLRVPSGAIVGLIGDNGTGKSTLLKLLPGLSKPDRGAVTVLGRDPWVDPVAVRVNLGYVALDQPLYPARLDRLLRYVSSLYPTWDGAFAQRLVDQMQLDLSKETAGLSTGLEMRLRLVMALAFRPQLVVLDEPTTGLDVWARRTLHELITELAQDAGRTFVIASHDLVDLQRVCTHYIRLDRGRIITNATAAELIPAGSSLEEALIASGRTP